MNQEIFHTYSGPQFIVGERVAAKGCQELPMHGTRVKWQPYNREPVRVPYSVITMPHEQGLLSESEKFELLEAPTCKPTLERETTRGEFIEHHQHRANIRTARDVDVSQRIPPPEDFYCKQNPETCMYCQRKNAAKTLSDTK
jgi:hypothetical protein